MNNLTLDVQYTAKFRLSSMLTSLTIRLRCGLARTHVLELLGTGHTYAGSSVESRVCLLGADYWMADLGLGLYVGYVILISTLISPPYTCTTLSRLHAVGGGHAVDTQATQRVASYIVIRAYARPLRTRLLLYAQCFCS